MPAHTYPGVYIEEIPSGVRTITGVATSITAFVGWAAQGPTDRAELVLSFSDFARKFGGLDQRSLLGYAVNHFFANGGQRAYVVRIVTAGSATVANNAKSATITLDTKLRIDAISEGNWGNSYGIVTKTRSDDATRFQLRVVKLNDDKTFATVESFDNLSMSSTDARSVAKVLASDSNYATATVVDASAPPTDTVIPSAGADKDKLPVASTLAGGVDGTPLRPSDAGFHSAVYPETGATANIGGVFRLDRIDLFNILCVPGEVDVATLGKLEKFCRDRRAFLIADCATGDTLTTLQNGPNSALTGVDSINAAFYFPWVLAPDPLQENRLSEFPPSGFMAGLYARTDSTRGVWKAPAGTEATLSGVSGVKVNLTDDENGVLNPKAVNCIRNFPVYGTIAWGARTLQGNDERGSEWKYIPVRRTALFIEESLFRATQWVVFEPNDEPLWAQIRLNVGAFMHDLFRQGAFQGTSPKDAYFVKCDRETTTQSDINQGIVHIVVGFAPLKPAEFVVIQLQQMAGQIDT
ncbi:MAG TPA: phage tail sheath subtilisin-like domain-containing protein [Chthoniobacteraceae bacterium]|jgi:phage tail sheath protein FI|nr:phage tail sheath subtilisin-like domain-containing protein [Chthoniobacteraceae bacterium]